MIILLMVSAVLKLLHLNNSFKCSWHKFSQDGWDDYDDAYGSSVSMSMTTDDSIDDGYGSVTTIDDGYSSTTNEDDGYSATVEVETEVVGDDNWGGDDKYAALAGDTAGVETDSTDNGIIDDNEYFDDDFVVDLPSDEDLKIV